jgi:isocitrate dehydrogenase
VYNHFIKAACKGETMTQTTVTLINGDGVGPETVEATRKIIDATQAGITWEVREAGAEVFKRGVASGAPPETIQSIRKNRVVLKGPLETPVGFGEKSANVTLRKLFETFANVRPVREYPNVHTVFQGRNLDLVIIRENVEDLYAGIEYMQTPGVAETLKLITRKGSEKIIRFAFEFVRAEGRKSLHCATKANIMKFTEGMFKRTFEEIAQEYPDIEASHIIVDNCAHQLVRSPEKFEAIVTTNLNGDILSDLGSGLIGGLGLAPSANLGNDIAIFEAVHGSAPKYAGKNVINPLAVIQAGILMLRHLGKYDAAQLIEQSMLFTLEQGIGTRDLKGDRDAVSTTEFTDIMIQNLGKVSHFWKDRDYRPIKMPQLSKDPDIVKASKHEVVGIDVFIESSQPAEALGRELEQLVNPTSFALIAIANRGVKVFPNVDETQPDVVDHWCVRFMPKDKGQMSDSQCIELLSLISQQYRWMHVEKLNIFNGAAGFSKSQGED